MWFLVQNVQILWCCRMKFDATVCNNGRTQYVNYNRQTFFGLCTNFQFTWPGDICVCLLHYLNGTVDIWECLEKYTLTNWIVQINVILPSWRIRRQLRRSRPHVLQEMITKYNIDNATVLCATRCTLYLNNRKRFSDLQNKHKSSTSIFGQV